MHSKKPGRNPGVGILFFVTPPCSCMSFWPSFPSLGHLLLHFIQSSARCVTIWEYRWSPYLRWDETEDPIHTAWNTPAAVLSIRIVAKQWMAAQLLPWGCNLKNNRDRHPELDRLCLFIKFPQLGNELLLSFKVHCMMSLFARHWAARDKQKPHFLLSVLLVCFEFEVWTYLDKEGVDVQRTCSVICQVSRKKTPLLYREEVISYWTNSRLCKYRLVLSDIGMTDLSRFPFVCGLIVCFNKS